MLLLRASALVVCILLAIEEIQPQWEWFAAVALLTLLGLRDEAGLALIVLSTLLAFETLQPELPWLVASSILAGAAALRNVGGWYRPAAGSRFLHRGRGAWGRTRRFALLASVFVLTTLLATEVIEPRWEWFGAIAILAVINVRDEISVLLVVLAGLLAFETIEPERAWLVVLSVLAGLALLRSLSRLYRPWAPYVPPVPFDPAPLLQTRPGARRRLRNWAATRDF